MNTIFFFMTFSTFSAVIYGLHPDFRKWIQAFYERSDFRTIMALYNKYTESNDTELVKPCQMYSDMDIILDPAEFTSIESNVIVSLNTNMVLTLNGHSKFPIHAVMECAVKKDNQEVFKFFVLLLPEWAKSFTKKNLEFIPVYNYGSTDENWEWFAVKDVYDFRVLKSTFTGHRQDQLRIGRSLRSSRIVPIMIECLREAAAHDTVELMDYKQHFDNFVLHLDEKSRVRIPAILVIKLQIEKKFIKYAYAVIFCDDPHVDYPPNPFRYPSNSNKGFRYTIFNTGKLVNGTLAFSLDVSLVNPLRNIDLIPSFITTLGM